MLGTVYAVLVSLSLRTPCFSLTRWKSSNRRYVLNAKYSHNFIDNLLDSKFGLSVHFCSYNYPPSRFI